MGIVGNSIYDYYRLRPVIVAGLVYMCLFMRVFLYIFLC